MLMHLCSRERRAYNCIDDDDDDDDDDILMLNHVFISRSLGVRSCIRCLITVQYVYTLCYLFSSLENYCVDTIIYDCIFGYFDVLLAVCGEKINKLLNGYLLLVCYVVLVHIEGV